ncbi:ABC transporter permease [Gordonia phosphorivorans]|uniref:ABC transporter permease n=1 Tax=Gordonia phosphorivorans TaxID=1056982 RepID=A0ABV6H7K0_9ACTN
MVESAGLEAAVMTLADHPRLAAAPPAPAPPAAPPAPTLSRSGRPSRRHRISRLLLRRTGTSLITLLLVSAGIFAVAALSPIDPLTAHLGDNYQSATQAQRDAARAAYGLDQSWWQSWAHWWTNLLHGDLGWSTTQHQPVSTVLAERLPFTLGLSAAALAAAALLSLALGTWAGLRAGRVPDRAVSGGVTVLAATPPFVLSLLLVAVFAVAGAWFPTAGAATPGLEAGGTDLLWHAVLPWAALTVSQLPWLTLTVRTAVADAAGTDPVTAARARGISGRRLLVGHVWPAAAGPSLALLGTRLPEVIAGAAIVEAVFGWPGVADALVTAATGADFPLLATLAMAAAGFVLAGSALSDAAAVALDPQADLTA